MSVLDDQTKLFLTVQEVADILRQSPHTTRRDAKNGLIPGAKRHGQRYLIHRETFRSWVCDVDRP